MNSMDLQRNLLVVFWKLSVLEKNPKLQSSIKNVFFVFLLKSRRVTFSMALWVLLTVYRLKSSHSMTVIVNAFHLVKICNFVD